MPRLPAAAIASACDWVNVPSDTSPAKIEDRAASRSAFFSARFSVRCARSASFTAVTSSEVKVPSSSN